MKPDSEGSEVKKTEQFVLDAYTYTEAETRMVEILEAEGIRPFEITQITKTTLVEVIRFAECDKWFKVKVSLTTVDVNKGTEKEANQYLLVSAEDAKMLLKSKKPHERRSRGLCNSVCCIPKDLRYSFEEWTPVTSAVLSLMRVNDPISSYSIIFI